MTRPPGPSGRVQTAVGIAGQRREPCSVQVGVGDERRQQGDGVTTANQMRLEERIRSVETDVRFEARRSAHVARPRPHRQIRGVECPRGVGQLRHVGRQVGEWAVGRHRQEQRIAEEILAVDSGADLMGSTRELLAEDDVELVREESAAAENFVALRDLDLQQWMPLGEEE